MVEGKEMLRDYNINIRRHSNEKGKSSESFEHDEHDEDDDEIIVPNVNKKRKKKKEKNIEIGNGAETEMSDEEKEKEIVELKNEAKKILKNALNEKMTERVSAETVFNVNKKPLLRSDIFYMGSHAGEQLLNDENALAEIVEKKNNGDAEIISPEYEQWILNKINTVDLNKLVFQTFIYNEIGKELARAKKSIENGEVADRALRQIDGEIDESVLVENVMKSISDESIVLQDFLKQRSKKKDAGLIAKSREEIARYIHREVGETLFVDESLDVPIKIGGQASSNEVEEIKEPVVIEVENEDNIIEIEKQEPIIIDNNVEVISELADVAENETEKNKQQEEPIDGLEHVDNFNVSDVKVENNNKAKERLLELFMREQEKMEEDVLRAILETTYDGNLDLNEAEKRWDENIKGKMEVLLNNSGFVDALENEEQAEEYWERLKEMQMLAHEILSLKERGKVCVIHDGKTYFIDKKEDAGGSDSLEVKNDQIEEAIVETKEEESGIIKSEELESLHAWDSLRENPEKFELIIGELRRIYSEVVKLMLINEEVKKADDNKKESILRGTMDMGVEIIIEKYHLTNDESEITNLKNHFFNEVHKL